MSNPSGFDTQVVVDQSGRAAKVSGRSDWYSIMLGHVGHVRLIVRCVQSEIHLSTAALWLKNARTYTLAATHTNSTRQNKHKTRKKKRQKETHMTNTINKTRDTQTQPKAHKKPRKTTVAILAQVTALARWLESKWLVPEPFESKWLRDLVCV